MRFANTKGVMELGDLALGLLFVAIVIGTTLVVLSEYSDKLTAGSAAQNAVKDLITEVTGLVGWVGVIILVAVAAIIFAYVRFFRRGAGGR